MDQENHLSGETFELARRPFNGTIDQLVGFNVADLRNKANLSQSDVGTIFERVTGREHSRNWLSLRETGQQPFSVAELIILAWIFNVPAVRLLKIDRLTGIVYIDGLTKPVRHFIDDFFIDSDRDAGSLVEWNVEPDLPERGEDLKEWAEHLRSERDSWLPWVAKTNREFEQTIRGEHEPHKTAGKRYAAWQRRYKQRDARVREVLRDATRENNGDNQED